MDTIITHGTVVTSDATYQADLGISNGVVAQIGRDLDGGAGCKRIDAAGKYVFPGGIDPHTHLDSRGQGTVTADDFYSGTVAAACGGTTSIVDFCFPAKGQSLKAGLDDWHSRAQGKAVIDYAFHMGILDDRDEIVDEIPEIVAGGVTTLKIFMAYKGGNMVSDWTFYRTLQHAAKLGALVLVHAEHGDAIALRERELLSEGKTAPKYHAVARPPRVEAEATNRAISLAELTGARVYIVHVTCSDAVDEIVRGRARGAQVWGETCTQYLYCSVDDLDRPNFEGAKYVCSPALREKWNQNVLWRAIGTDTLQAVSSDHSPFNFNQADHKQRGHDNFTIIPNGVPGIEERLMMVYQGVNAGHLGLNRFVELTSTNAARLMGLFPKKGTIAVGSDADLVIWNPSAEITLGRATLHHNVDYSLFEGTKVHGIPETVLSRGDVIVANREPVAVAGRGQYMARKVGS